MQPDGGRSALGEAVAHAPPARRGAMRLHGATPLWSLGNQWEPFYIVTPKRANSVKGKGKNVCEQFLKTFSINVVNIAANFEQLRFFHFLTNLFSNTTS